MISYFFPPGIIPTHLVNQIYFFRIIKGYYRSISHKSGTQKLLTIGDEYNPFQSRPTGKADLSLGK